MAAKLGNGDASFRLGNVTPTAVYLGTEEVWSDSPPPLPGFLVTSGGNPGYLMSTTTGYATFEWGDDTVETLAADGLGEINFSKSAPASLQYRVYSSDASGNPSGGITTFFAAGYSSGIASLIVSSLETAATYLDIGGSSGANMNAEALNALYASLPPGGGTLLVAGNPGFGDGDDQTIATAKGWTVA